MMDVERLVRDALARHEADVPVPNALEAGPVAVRARRRQVLNAVGAGLVALVIALGAISGVGALLRADARRPAIEPTPTPRPPAPASAPVVFPPPGIEASTPSTGEVIVSFYAEDVSGSGRSHWERISIDVYADGRIIWSRCSSTESKDDDHPIDWTGTDEGCVLPPTVDASDGLSTGWVQQRLTTEAVEVLRTELLATGLFEGKWESVTPNSTDLIDWMFVDVRDGNRMRNIRVDYQTLDFNPPTPRQLAGLEHLQEIFLNLEGWFPASAWAEREVVPFVPSSYSFYSKRGPAKALLRAASSGTPLEPLEPADLPAPADRLLTRKGCSVVTLDEAQAILAAFEAVGITRSAEMSNADLTAFLVRDGEDGAAVYFQPNMPDSSASC
jgi:hypothetical protein